jgi:hypothetical protein
VGNKVRQQTRRQNRERRKERKKLTVRQRIDKQLSVAMKERPCDECTACCTVMAVEEISKPLGEPCQHLCNGCSIYESRPQPCREFNCCWRYGLGNDSERPDKSGIVFDVTRHNQNIPQALIAREVWPGAFEQSQAFLDRLASNGHLIILVRGGRRTAIGPPQLVALVQKAIEAMA